jgi:uncharacterized protein DUF11
MKGTTVGGSGRFSDVGGRTRGTSGVSWGHVVALVAAMAAASCACANPRPKSGWDGPPPKSAAARQSESAAASSKLKRPDLPPGWNWSGQAIPTGDPDTSVIKLEKFAPAMVGVGAEYAYKVRVTNISDGVPLNDVTVKDRLPGEGYSFASADPPGERSGDQIAWNIGRLAPGESRDIVVRGKASKAGSMGGFASVSYAPLVGVDTMAVAAVLGLQRLAPAEVVQCDEITLRFVLANTGNGAAGHARIVEQLPDGWTVDGSRTLTIDAGTLKPGETRELKAVAKASKTGDFTGSATATADGGIEARAESRTSVRIPKLEISREPNDAARALGSETVLKITVKNTGDGPARTLVIEDAIEGADRIVMVSDGGIVTGTNVKWQLGTLDAGATRTVSVTVTRAAAGAVTETTKATAFCADPASSIAKTNFGGSL